MPTYVYKREDGTTFELQQKMSDPVLETCPTTGQPVKRMIGAGAGLIFKGDGFYITDYARKGKPAGGSESKSDAKLDATPETVKPDSTASSSKSTDGASTSKGE